MGVGRRDTLPENAQIKERGREVGRVVTSAAKFAIFRGSAQRRERARGKRRERGKRMVRRWEYVWECGGTGYYAWECKGKGKGKGKGKWKGVRSMMEEEGEGGGIEKLGKVKVEEKGSRFRGLQVEDGDIPDLESSGDEEDEVDDKNGEKMEEGNEKFKKDDENKKKEEDDEKDDAWSVVPGRWRGNRKRVKALAVVEPVGVRVMDKVPEWEVLEMAVDSGAGETVLEDGVVKCVEAVEGEAKKRGVRYEVADGTLMENEGEKEFVAMTEEGNTRKLVGQVCGVNKSLLSVRKVTGAGNTVVFKKGYGWIENDKSGEKTWMEEKDGMYVVRLWVPRDQGGFTRR